MTNKNKITKKLLNSLRENFDKSQLTLVITQIHHVYCEMNGHLKANETTREVSLCLHMVHCLPLPPEQPNFPPFQWHSPISITEYNADSILTVNVKLGLQMHKHVPVKERYITN